MLASSLVSSATIAATTQSVSQPTNKAEVIIYQSPQTNSTVVEKINPGERLVGIFNQGDWIKVGDPRNGQTGWVNREQYQQVINKYFQSNIQTVYIRTASNDKNAPNIIAYQNGKKLSDKDAKQLYQRIQKQQLEQTQYMQKVFWNMQNVMDQNIHELNQPFNPWNELNIGLMPQPIIVINSSK
jgi:hypothetical protein